jgi:DNA polymerase III subunit gamma/tau
MTFYLKYRPQTLDDLDSNDVRTTLKKILLSDNMPHAFLFAGVRGTGKTSAARIVAKVINCEKAKVKGEICGICDQCVSITNGSNLDVIEIDAASHRGIDDIRAIRDAVRLSPAKALMKIYIIDEAHMLTTEAANALLKTLEEPPDHVIFILATTNPEKLPITIRSRTTEVIFNKATDEEILSSLKKINKTEKLKLSDETLQLLIRNAGGSYRDAVKNLEKVASLGITSPEDIKEHFYKRVDQTALDLLTKIKKGEVTDALQLVEVVTKSGVLISNLIEETENKIRGSMLIKSGVTGDDILPDYSLDELLRLTKALFVAKSELVDSYIEQLPLEMVIINFAKSKPTIMSSPPGEQQVDSSTKTVEQLENGTWEKVMAAIKPVNTSVEALLRMTRVVGYDGKTVTLGVSYKFHKERLEEIKNKLLIEDVFTKILCKNARIACVLTEKDDIVKKAKEIFDTNV